MNNRITYFVSRKNIFTWLSAVSILLSAVLRIYYFWGTGTSRANTWWSILLPLIGSFLFLIIILFDGKEHFYRTALPVFMFAAYFMIRIALSVSIRIVWISWIAYATIAVFYFLTTNGKMKFGFWLFLIFAGFTALQLYQCRYSLIDGIWDTSLRVLPDVLIPAAGAFIMLAMQPHLDAKYHPEWGDRSDGRRIRTANPMVIATAYIMPTRVGASNFVRDKVEITEIENYIRKKREEGYKNFGFMHVLLAAYIRCIAKYPAINRFLSGQRVYSRGNDIQFCMVVKSNMTLAAEDSVTKVHFTPADTIFDVYDKLNEAVKKIQKNDIGSSDFDKVEKMLSLIQGFLYRFVVWLLRCLDYVGLLPKFLLEVSPFHGSIFFTSMASLGIPPVVHHLYDFGNLPVFCAFGAKYYVNEIEKENSLIGYKVVRRKYIDYTFNTDERIVDGFYFATVLKYLRKLLAHPEKLELPPEEIIRDID